MAVFDAHKLTNIDAITESLWQNVVRMQTRNQPIPDATARGYMPQPDPYGPVLHYLENGTLTDLLVPNRVLRRLTSPWADRTDPP